LDKVIPQAAHGITKMSDFGPFFPIGETLLVATVSKGLRTWVYIVDFLQALSCPVFNERSFVHKLVQ